MGKQNKFHHNTSSWMRNFAGKNTTFYVYDKIEKVYLYGGRATNPNKICETFYYKTDAWSDEAEAQYGEIERVGSPILADVKLKNSIVQITDVEKRNFYKFISIQIFRSKKTRSLYKEKFGFDGQDMQNDLSYVDAYSDILENDCYSQLIKSQDNKFILADNLFVGNADYKMWLISFPISTELCLYFRDNKHTNINLQEIVDGLNRELYNHKDYGCERYIFIPEIFKKNNLKTGIDVIDASLHSKTR